MLWGAASGVEVRACGRNSHLETITSDEWLPPGEATLAASQLTAQKESRGEEIAEPKGHLRVDAMYGWNTAHDGLGFNSVAGVGIVRMRYQGRRSAMFDDTRVYSDSKDPNELPLAPAREQPLHVK